MQYYRDLVLANMAMFSFCSCLVLGLIAWFIDPLPMWLMWFGRGVGGMCLVSLVALGWIYMHKVREARRILMQKNNIHDQAERDTQTIG